MSSAASLKYFDCGDIYRWQKDLISYHFAFSSLNKIFGWAHAREVLPKRNRDAE